MPDKNKYNAKKPKNNPNGSDLNHPISPLSKTGEAIANINDAIRPADVPPTTRTNAKTTTDVKDPIIRGNIIVKS